MDGAVLFGYDQGVFSGIVTNNDWKQVFNSPGSALEGIIVSIYNLGAFAGCILTFFIAEKLGRRMCMWFAMIWIVCYFQPRQPLGAKADERACRLLERRCSARPMACRS